MEDLDFRNSKFLDLRCKLNSNDLHILVDPVILPCENKICFKCAEKMIENEELCLCGQMHRKQELLETQNNEKINSIYENIYLNTKEILNETIDKLIEYAEGSKSVPVWSDDEKSEIINQSKKKLAKRVDVLQNNLNFIEADLVSQLHYAKTRIQAKCNELEYDYKSLKNEITQMLESGIKSEEWQYENEIERIERLKQNYHRLTQEQMSFTPSRLTLDRNILGHFEIE